MPDPEDAPSTPELADAQPTGGYVALMDTVNYRNSDGDHMTALRGAPIVDADPKAVDRLVALKAIGSEDDLAATEAADRPMLAAEAAETGLTAAQVAANVRAEQIAVARMQASTGEQPTDPSFGTSGRTVEQVAEGDAGQLGDPGTLKAEGPAGATTTGSPAAMTSKAAQEAVAAAEQKQSEDRPAARSRRR